MDMEKDVTLSVHMHNNLNNQLPDKRKLALTPLQVIAGSPSLVLNFSPSRIFYHSFRETSGTTKAAYQITDGLGGPILLTVSLAASESTRDFFGEPAILANQSLYFKLISGAVEGVVGSVLEEDYQASINQTEVVNFPGEVVKVNE